MGPRPPHLHAAVRSGTARDPSGLDEFRARYPDTVRPLALDVTDDAGIERAVTETRAAFGRLDVLVNNAGHGFVGAIEGATPTEYRPLFDVNVFGLIEMTRAALPLMRATGGGGRIVNMSSMAGLVGMGGHGYYNATKFAVEGLSEAPAQEVAPFGIRIVIVEPGPFRTGFLGRSMAVARSETPGCDATGRQARLYREGNDGLQPGGPEKAVAIILKAVDQENPPLHLPPGKRAYDLVRVKLGALAEEMDRWEAVATATDH